MDADPQSSSATLLWAPHAWIDGGWQAQVLLHAGSDGRWAEVRAGVDAPPQAEVLPGATGAFARQPWRVQWLATHKRIRHPEVELLSQGTLVPAGTPVAPANEKEETQSHG